MRKGYPSAYEPRGSKGAQRQHKQKQAAYIESGLKSLECSSVQEVPPTNQSYEMSWLQKLVTGIDKEQNNEKYFEEEAMKRKDEEMFKQQFLKKNFILQNSYKGQRDLGYKTEGPYHRNRVQEQTKETKKRYYDENIYLKNDKKDYGSHEKYQYSRGYDKSDRIETEPYSKASKNYGMTKSLMKNEPVYHEQYEKRRNNIINYQQSDLNTSIGKIRRSNNIVNERSDKFMREKERKQITFPKQSPQKRKENSEMRKKSYKFDDGDQFKMDQMAKRLNNVLKNINQKQKKLSSYTLNPVSQNSQRRERPKENFNENKFQYDKWKQNQRYEKPTMTGQVREKENPLQKYERSQNTNRFKKQAITYEDVPKKTYDRPVYEKIETKRSLNEQKSSQKFKPETIQRKRRASTIHLSQSQKYQEMKKSLGFTRHLPPEIIIQESSSSQWASQISPRLNIFNKEFAMVFDKLDKQKSGKLSQRNCAIENIPEELKYLFGGVLSKIKYKNEEFTIKRFFKECKYNFKQFVLEELQQIFQRIGLKQNSKVSDYKNFKNFQSHETYTKRSLSNASEVVKKYEFENLPSQREQKAEVLWKLRDKNISKTPYLRTEESTGEQQGILRNRINLNNGNERKVKYQFEGSDSQVSKENFQKRCESLNNKLNNYITCISHEKGPAIKLEFQELAKHWRGQC